MGLVKAVQRFDHRRGVPFTSYAVPTIVGELKRYLRDTSWAVHVPQRMRDRALEVDRATERLRRALGRSPTTAEVADETGPTVPEVLDAAEAATAYDAVSLDAPGARRRRRSDAADSLGVEEAATTWSSTASRSRPALRALPRAPARDPAPAVRGGHDPGGDRARCSGSPRCTCRGCCGRRSGRLRAVARVRHAA